jgi:hypothetical protein
VTYQETGTIPQRAGITRSQTHALFGQTMGYVALTAGLFALGAYLGRNLTGGVGIFAFLVAFAALIGMRFAAKRSQELTVALLGVFGVLIGLAVAPTISYYGSMDPRALWDAGGATALAPRRWRPGPRSSVRSVPRKRTPAFWGKPVREARPR